MVRCLRVNKGEFLAEQRVFGVALHHVFVGMTPTIGYGGRRPTGGIGHVLLATDTPAWRGRAMLASRLRMVSLIRQLNERRSQLTRRVGLKAHQKHELAAKLTRFPDHQLQLHEGTE